MKIIRINLDDTMDEIDIDDSISEYFINNNIHDIEELYIWKYQNSNYQEEKLVLDYILYDLNHLVTYI